MGTDEEETEHLRQRYFESIQYEPFAGNKKAYRDETNAMEGILATKVYPTNDPEKGYNILLIVAGDNYQPVSDDKCKEIKNYYAPEENGGMGKAPIFQKIEGESCTSLLLNFKIACAFKGGDNQFEIIIEPIKNILQQYIDQVNQEWEKEENLLIRINVVSATLYQGLKEYIKDISSIRINDSTGNIELERNQVAMLGNVEELQERGE